MHCALHCVPIKRKIMQRYVNSFQNLTHYYEVYSNFIFRSVQCFVSVGPPLYNPCHLAFHYGPCNVCKTGPQIDSLMSDGGKRSKIREFAAASRQHQELTIISLLTLYSLLNSTLSEDPTASRKAVATSRYSSRNQ